MYKIFFPQAEMIPQECLLNMNRGNTLGCGEPMTQFLVSSPVKKHQCWRHDFCLLTDVKSFALCLYTPLCQISHYWGSL